MISKIKFDLDFETKQAVITGVVSADGTDDVRDMLALAFTQAFSGSSLCRIQFRQGMITPHNPVAATRRDLDATAFTITPIRDNQEGIQLVKELLSQFSPIPDPTIQNK